MRKRVLLLFNLILIGSLLFGKGTRESTIEPLRAPLDENNKISIALPLSEDPIFLNPIEATDANSLLILEPLFEGLFSRDPKTGLPIKAIAKEYTISEDRLKWTFTLDSKARFSNGEQITAQSFIDSWFWLLDQSNENSFYLLSLMEPILGVKEYQNKKVGRSSVGLKALNKETLEITLINQAPYLKALLATTPLAVIHSSFRDNKNSFKEENIISSGPFVIKDFASDKVLLQKNKWYRSYDFVQSDFIEILTADQVTVEKRYKEKKLHWSLAYIPLQILNSPLDLHIGPEYSTGFYYFSAKQGPYANERIREALSLFIPWDELRKESRQIFPTKNLIPGNSDAPTSLVDENRAYKILAEEGFPYGAALPPLYMAVHRGSQIFESAKLIADLWSLKLGITVVLDVVPLSLYSRYPENTPYDFAFITWIGDIHDPFAFLTLFKGDSSYNLGNYFDEVYDNLLEKALTTNDDQQRTLIINQAEQRLLNQKAIFPIYHGITTNIVATDLIDGWYDNILNVHPLQYLTLKK